MNGDWQETRWFGGTVTKRWTRATTAQQPEPARRTMKMNAEATRPSLITVSRFFNLLPLTDELIWFCWKILEQLRTIFGCCGTCWANWSSFLEEITTWSQRHFYSGEKEMKCTALRDTRPGGFRLAVRWRGAEIIFWLWEKKGKNSRRMCWRFLIYFYLIYSCCGIFFNKIYFQFYFQVPTGGTFP